MADERSDGKTSANGVLDGSPADLFENFSAGEAQLIDDASPFRTRPTPIGGSRKGVPNKRTAQMRDLYLKSGFPHPLLWMGSMLRMGIDGVASALGCTPYEAADLLRKVANDAAPYIESKRPTELKAADGEGLPVLIVGNVAVHGRSAVEQRSDGSMAIDDDLAEAIEQNQRVIDAKANKSHDD